MRWSGVGGRGLALEVGRSEGVRKEEGRGERCATTDRGERWMGERMVGRITR